MPSHLPHALAVMLALTGSIATAHSTKEATTPSDGAVLTRTPETIGMTFDSPMRVTWVRLLSATGAELPLERRSGPEPAREFVADPAALAPGRYVVEWRGLAADGHAMQGSFSFELTD